MEYKYELYLLLLFEELYSDDNKVNQRLQGTLSVIRKDPNNFFTFSSRLYNNKQKRFFTFFKINFLPNLELRAVRDSLCQLNESQQHLLYFSFLFKKHLYKQGDFKSDKVRLL